MKHLAEIVAYNKLSNGQFSFCLRCCGNASTDSWHTLDSAVLSNPKKKKASMAAAAERVAKEHEAAKKAEEAAVELMGQNLEVT